MQRTTFRDRQMVLFIEKYGALTPDLASRLFYTGLKSGKEQAGRRLQMLFKMGKVKRSMIVTCSPQYYNYL